MISGKKIEEIAIWHCQSKGYKRYSFKRFCNDFDFNYAEFTDYKNERKNNNKVVFTFLELFPNLNMNWLLKDEENMFDKEDNLHKDIDFDEKLRLLEAEIMKLKEMSKNK